MPSLPDGSAAAFEPVLDAVPDAIVGVRPDGRIVFLNVHAEQLFGYRREDLVGRHVVKLVPDATEPSPEMTTGLERTGRRHDGTTFPVEISLGPVDTEEGPLFLAAVRDMSDRRRAELMLRGLLEGAPDAIVGVRADGSIALVNAQAERLFGYDRDELVGHPLEKLIPEEARAVHPGHRRAYFRNPVTRPMGAGLDLAGRRRDGTTFPAEISLSAIETDEGILVSAAVRDMTDRVELERERRRQALEAQRQQAHRLESLGELAGGVAHDFNNLLGVILNYADFVARRVADDPVAVADVAEIRQAAERAAQLTRQLLTVGRREMVKPEVLDLNDVLTDIERLLRRTIGEHLELVTNAAPGLSPVRADRGQLEQVLLNLAVNARDAMSRGGTLHVDTADVEFDETVAEQHVDLAPGRYVRLRVSDTGVGMDSETVRRAFEPFFTTKPKDRGTGLGLATVYGIVTQAGGSVHLYSEPGTGTTVAVYLPATEGVPTRRAVGAEVVPEGGSESILVVEDEDAFREVTRRILAEHGYRVTVASRPDEALAVLHNGDGIDILLSDVVMPGMSGPDLLQEARRLRPTLPAVLMSGYAEPILAARMRSEGAPEVLEKPFTAERLLRTVRTVLDRRGRS